MTFYFQNFLRNHALNFLNVPKNDPIESYFFSRVFSQVWPSTGTPALATFVSGLAAAVAALFIRLEILVEMMSIGKYENTLLRKLICNTQLVMSIVNRIIWYRCHMSTVLYNYHTQHSYLKFMVNGICVFLASGSICSQAVILVNRCT